MNNIEQVFLRYPYTDTVNRIEWFNTITINLFGILPHNKTLRPSRYASAAVKMKHDPKLGPRVYENVVVVEFNSLYIHTLLTFSDEFSVPHFKKFVADMIAFRKECINPELKISVKAYLNTIFGQFDGGLVQHHTMCINDIVELSKKEATKLYQHPTTFYVDTDQVYFAGISLADVKQFVEHTIDTRTFPVSYEEYKTCEVTRLKKIITVR